MTKAEVRVLEAASAYQRAWRKAVDNPADRLARQDCGVAEVHLLLLAQEMRPAKNTGERATGRGKVTG